MVRITIDVEEDHDIFITKEVVGMALEGIGRVRIVSIVTEKGELNK